VYKRDDRGDFNELFSSLIAWGVDAVEEHFFVLDLELR
jgi:hypothetical protein